MTWTRLEVETAVKDLLDAAGSSRWSQGVIHDAATIVYRREWGKILDAYPTYRFARITATTDSSGQIALSTLSTGSGDSQERFYRIVGQRLYVGTTPYTQATPQDHAYPLGQPTTASTARLWWREGSSLQVLPVESGLSVVIPVSHLPTAFNALAGDSSVVEWPEDYELIPVYLTAGLLLAKGDAETRGTADFARIADALRTDLLADIAGLTTGPQVPRASDSPAEWGG